MASELLPIGEEL